MEKHSRFLKSSSSSLNGLTNVGRCVFLVHFHVASDVLTAFCVDVTTDAACCSYVVDDLPRLSLIFYASCLEELRVSAALWEVRPSDSLLESHYEFQS
jgi:hypothetical protein